MKKTCLRISAVVSTAVLLLGLVVPVAADSATNDTTGYDSDNYSYVKNVNNVSVSSVSDAYISNTVKDYANTGNNNANYNTMGGVITTGKATTHTSVENAANINTVLIDPGMDAGASHTAGNSITGAESTNMADILNENKVKVVNDSTAVLRSRIGSAANTGGNSASYNTDGVGGSILTGPASSTVEVENRANDNAVCVKGLAGGSEGIVGNSITGSGSENYAYLKNLNSVDVKNVSDAYVENRVRSFANTGRNHADYNTMGGDVTTGKGISDVFVGTDANINTVLIDVGFGDPSETSGNSITGAESTNMSDILNENSFKVYNSSNKCESKDCKDYDLKNWGVINDVEDKANTGGNEASMNTFAGVILSGIAEASKEIMVRLNDTWVEIGPGVTQHQH
jgi:hypothetical protein